jgi:hypothetical protein
MTLTGEVAESVCEVKDVHRADGGWRLGLVMFICVYWR